MDTVDNSNTFSIMLATDIHLGVNEKDGVRAEDSFTTFEEILRISKERDVDFILLGGDLFHDNRPSPQCYYKCLALLRKYCMGEKPIDVKILSDRNTLLKNSEFPILNYEDPNFVISIPVFSIHGNHDDPSGFGRMSALDLLSVSGYVNYFGKWTDLNQVKVYPLMLKKGTSKLAIYGLSHIKDERLYRLMKHNEVEYILPKGNPKEFFNLMVLHQNRVDRPGTKHIPESLLPSFLNLVLWGHEHDCRVTPEWNQEKQFYVTQPGSSVATSLCEGEALQKNVAILRINGGGFKLEPIPLKTVRPFVFDSVALSDWNMRLGNKPSDKIQEYVDRYIRATLLEKAKDLITDDPKQPQLPLVRLRIEYELEEECFNVIRFGQTFTGLVANPSDMILMKKKMKEVRQPRKGVLCEDLPELSSFQDINLAIPDLMQQYFDGLPEKSRLKVLGRISISEAVTRFINKDDKEALDDIIYYDLKKVRDYLEKENADPDSVTMLLDQYNEMKINASQNEELEEVRRFLESDSRRDRDIPSIPSNSRTMDVDSDDEDFFGPPPSTLNNTSSTTKGRGRGAARGRGSRSASRSRSRARNSGSDRSTLDTSVTRSNSSRSTSSRSITSYLIPNEDNNGNSQNAEELFGSSSCQPQPKKKMKFSYVDDE
ncbi:hypothetical protein O3M35_000753 [Rhynocoris fuscipes]|uniref:Double-strand break repair protein n=1 Tax=Rhynocoris fuscipes TaxID=488301 RepID=A0AAW1DMV3_9HEMI